MRKEVQRGNVIISHARALITFYTHNHGRHHVHSFALRDYRSRHLSKAAAKEGDDYCSKFYAKVVLGRVIVVDIS